MRTNLCKFNIMDYENFPKSTQKYVPICLDMEKYSRPKEKTISYKENFSPVEKVLIPIEKEISIEVEIEPPIIPIEEKINIPIEDNSVTIEEIKSTINNKKENSIKRKRYEFKIFPKHWDDILIQKYKSYFFRSRKQQRPIELSYEEFEKLLSQSCIYCGSDKKITIDRNVPLKGYVPGNCFPCCYQCNMMKHMFSEEQFLSQIRKIAKYLELI